MKKNKKKKGTKYEVALIEKTEVRVDVSLLRKTEEMFFNATEMAKPFGKKVNDFLRLISTKEFIQVIFKDGNPRLKNYKDLVKIKKGKYGGTYLHNELAFEFAGWLSPLFRRNLYKWAEERLLEEETWKKERLEAKTGYLPMTEAIIETHDDPKFYHYSNEADMINRIVLGKTAKQYKEHYDCDDVREHATEKELAIIKSLQKANTVYIEDGINFGDRKARLIKRYEKRQKPRSKQLN